jgi:hypothetical protein
MHRVREMAMMLVERSSLCKSFRRVASAAYSPANRPFTPAAMLFDTSFACKNSSR